MLFFPFPSVTQELVASQIGLLDSLPGQTIHHFRLRSDRSMVRTRYPTSVLTHHTGTANQDILDRIVKHMSHVQYAGDVRGRDYNRIRLTTVWL